MCEAWHTNKIHILKQYISIVLLQPFICFLLLLLHIRSILIGLKVWNESVVDHRLAGWILPWHTIPRGQLYDLIHRT